MGERVESGAGEGSGYRFKVPVLDLGAHGPGERRDAAERRERVLWAARELFAERGVAAVSMYEIGRYAGVGQGTLYRRYEHKGALCSALLAESAECFAGEIRERARSEEPALAQLEHLLVRLAGFNEANAPLLGAIRDAAGGERRSGMYRNPFYQWLRATVVALLSRAVTEGEAGTLDVECIADMVLAPLNIDLYLYQREGLDMEPERITRSLRRLLASGLRGAG